MTTRAIIIPLFSECQRFERWSECIKPVHLVEGKPIIAHARDSLGNFADSDVYLVIGHHQKPENIEQIKNLFPDATIVESNGLTLPQILNQILSQINYTSILLTDADSIFSEQILNLNLEQKSDAVLFGSRCKMKSRLGLSHQKKMITSLTPHPEESIHSACGTFFVTNQDRFLQFLNTARDEDSAAELIKSWFHWGAKIEYFELNGVYNLISKNHILQYQGRFGQGYHSLKEFYPYYLSEHIQPGTKIFHFIGTSLALSCLILGILKLMPIYFLYALICGYAFAWISHMVIEHNRPATFKYPFYSLASDFIMFFELLTRKRSFADPSVE